MHNTHASKIRIETARHYLPWARLKESAKAQSKEKCGQKTHSAHSSRGLCSHRECESAREFRTKHLFPALQWLRLPRASCRGGNHANKKNISGRRRGGRRAGRRR